MQLERRRLGYWVLGFLLVFGVLAYLLKQEIWKDVK
jgi:ubiquinol-cytochrome c reductase cytochrome c1 subunit